MSRSEDRGATDSGVLVYPKLDVSKVSRESEPRMPRQRKASSMNKLYAIFVAALVAGGAGGFVLRPMVAPDKRVAALETAAAEAEKAANAQKDRADALDKTLTAVTAAKVTSDHKLDDAQKAQRELAGKMADAELKAKEAEAVQAKLEAAVDKGTGSVSTEGDEIHLQLVDRVLFKTGDDHLTDRGKQVIAKIATALKDLPDKQVWVQGHTDDQPIFNPAPPKKPAKGAPPPAPPRFATNWELSAARALNVVHYLQDTAKLDPTRLAALAFSQYRPVSRGNKAANRRIEIVLVPKRAVLQK
jgi:chemotaxis protein MotB